MKKIALTLIASTLSSLTVAAPLSAQQVLEQFNLVALGSVSSTSDVDGRAYIGGSVSGGGYATQTAKLASSAYAGLTVAGSADRVYVNNNGLVVGGDLSNSTIQNNNAHYDASAAVLGNSTGNAFNVTSYVAGTRSGGYANATPLAQAPATVDAAAGNDLRAILGGLSSSLSQMKSTDSTVITDNPGYPTTTFHAVANAQGIAVFDLSADDTRLFGLSRQFVFDYGNARTVIINVDDALVDISAHFIGDNAAVIAGTNTIWNFYKASALTINAQFGGTILAPLAHLTNGSSGANIEGGVFVDTLTQNSEIHGNRFAGTVGTPTKVTTGTAPEPQGHMLMLGGLALLALVTRRRRA